MTQEERWLAKYNEVMGFVKANKRNPSRHDAHERYRYCNWLKHNKKLFNSGELKEERVEKLTIVDFRHDSTMFKQVWHCARCSESLRSCWR